MHCPRLISSLAFAAMIVALQSCHPSQSTSPEKLDPAPIKTLEPIADTVVSSGAKVPEKDTLRVMVVPCANGYEYAMHNYDFNPLLEEELSRLLNLNVIPFPFHKMQGVYWQGVFDTRYCPPILERVEVDVLVLTRFVKGNEERKAHTMDWGYEVRLVDAKSLQQSPPIRANGFDNYEALLDHIRQHTQALGRDLNELYPLTE